MTARTHLENYLKGLATNNPALFLPAMAEGYYMDDPNSMKISKANMVEFMSGFAALVISIRGNSTHSDHHTRLVIPNQPQTASSTSAI
jgi:hypothetical protein